MPSPGSSTLASCCSRGGGAVLQVGTGPGIKLLSSPSDPTELRQRATPGSGSVSRWNPSASRYLTARRAEPPQLLPRGRGQLFVLSEFRGDLEARASLRLFVDTCSVQMGAARPGRKFDLVTEHRPQGGLEVGSAVACPLMRRRPDILLKLS